LPCHVPLAGSCPRALRLRARERRRNR